MELRTVEISSCCGLCEFISLFSDDHIPSALAKKLVLSHSNSSYLTHVPRRIASCYILIDMAERTRVRGHHTSTIEGSGGTIQPVEHKRAVLKDNSGVLVGW